MQRDCPKGSANPWGNKGAPRSPGKLGGGKAGGAGFKSPGKGNTQDPTGGNPNATQICKHFAANAQCRFAPNCQYKHVYGTQGAFSHVASETFRWGRDCTIPVDSIKEADLEWDPEMGAYKIHPEREIEVSCNCAVATGMCDADGAEGLKEFLELGGEGWEVFQGRR